jgi:hypothetical protein
MLWSMLVWLHAVVLLWRDTCDTCTACLMAMGWDCWVGGGEFKG